jgi:cytochrome c peroxidase
VIDTAAMEVTETLALGGAPYAICVSNDLDENDDDETLYVTDFFALDRTGEEATDTGRRARVFAVSTGDGAVAEIALDAFDDAGIEAVPDSGVFPNQLYGCALNDEHLYVTSVGASPEPLGITTDFRQNVQGLVHAIEVESGAVDEARTVNLNALVDAQAAPKRFVAIPADIAFAPNSDFGYVASLASNSVLRVDWSVVPPVAGSPSGASFLPASLSPTGIAISGTTAYVYNEVARSVSVTDLAAQETVAEVDSAPQPGAADESDILAGQRFFNTGLARWSNNGWVSCASCHPFGTTDNVTWTFPTGPRQSIDLTATFDASGSVQRILNWSAIFDEVHDFELNTRTVADGTGAIVSDAGLNADGSPNTEARIDFAGLNGFNFGSAAAVAAGGATPDDWDHIEDYIRSLRSPHARTVTEGDPEAGRQVFLDGGCQNCHGGALWTLSERYYNPLLNSDASTVTLAEAGVADVGDVRADQLESTDTSTFSVIDVDANGPPHRHSCVVRRVGTFDADGPDGHGAAEIRQNGDPAQGVDGFNVPSLLGIGMGAPFLHNGAAASLEELLSDEFGSHLRSGNQVFSPTDEQRADLVAFLQTIDDDTETVAVPSGQQFCPTGFSPPVVQPE